MLLEYFYTPPAFRHHPYKVEIFILHLIQPSLLFIGEMDDSHSNAEKVFLCQNHIALYIISAIFFLRSLFWTQMQLKCN